MKTINTFLLMLCLATTTLLQGAGISNDPCKKYKNLLQNILSLSVTTGQYIILNDLLNNKYDVKLDVNMRDPQTNLTLLESNCKALAELLTELNDDQEIQQNESSIHQRFKIWEYLKDAGADLTRPSFLTAKDSIIKSLKKFIKNPIIRKRYLKYKKDLGLEAVEAAEKKTTRR